MARMPLEKAFLEPVEGFTRDILYPPRENDDELCQEETLILWIEGSKESNTSSSMEKNDMLPYWNQTEDIRFTKPDVSILGEELLKRIKEFDINDITSITIDATRPSQSMKVRKRKLVEINTSIRDTSYKWFVSQNDVLFARILQGANINNKDKFTIALYIRNGIPAVTINLKDRDLYLAYRSDKLQLTQMKDENKDDDMFYFSIHNTTNFTYSFNPGSFPTLFISTSQQDNLPTAARPAPANNRIIDFMFDSRLYGSNLKTANIQGLIIVLKWCQ